jgi:hypothetical protein
MLLGYDACVANNVDMRKRRQFNQALEYLRNRAVCQIALDTNSVDPASRRSIADAAGAASLDIRVLTYAASFNSAHRPSSCLSKAYDLL